MVAARTILLFACLTLAMACHGGGGSGCCQKNNMPVIVNCGQGGGGCQPGYGCGRYGCAKVKSFGALTKRVDGALVAEEDGEQAYNSALERLAHHVHRENVSAINMRNPNFVFRSCCESRGLPDACVRHCNYNSFGVDTLQSMFYRHDACPIHAANEIQFCAAQGIDHRRCCENNGVGSTLAGDKCIALCDQRPNRFTSLDTSFLPCMDVFDNMKQCFFTEVRARAEAKFQQTFISEGSAGERHTQAKYLKTKIREEIPVEDSETIIMESPQNDELFATLVPVAEKKHEEPEFVDDIKFRGDFLFDDIVFDGREENKARGAPSATPAEPIEPAKPSQQEPSHPAEPSNAAVSSHPSEPGTAQLKSAKPLGRFEPSESSKTAKPVEPAGSSESTEKSDRSELAEPAERSDRSEPAQPAETTDRSYRSDRSEPPTSKSGAKNQTDKREGASEQNDGDMLQKSEAIQFFADEDRQRDEELLMDIAKEKLNLVPVYEASTARPLNNKERKFDEEFQSLLLRN